jgi:hypothetical protein
MSEPQKMSGFCDWTTIDPDVDKPARERQKRLERLLAKRKEEGEK